MAGNIDISAPEMIYLYRSTLTAEADSTGSGFGNGGNLTIDTVLLDPERQFVDLAVLLRQRG
jgi:hypothetical protein